MNYLKLGTIIIVLVSFFIGGCSSNQLSSSKPSEYYKEKINNAQEIIIEEALMSIGKQYNIYVDKEKVATVEGKFITTIGNTFIMKDVNGTFLIKEEEIKRFGPFDVTRLAEIKNEKNEVVGYIGEKYWDKLFSVGWSFHFFDKDKNEIGSSYQLNFAILKENIFYNKKNSKPAYNVKANLSFVDKYTLKVYDKSEIPLYHAILMVCIEDVIQDAEGEKK